jgi:TonB-dependent receptor
MEDKSMKPSFRFSNWAIIFLVLALSVLPGTAHSQSDSGTVTGQVLDSAGNPLSGAEVTVVGTTLSAVTGENGSYRIVAVPAGMQTLEFNYLGTGTSTVEVEIPAGSTLTQNAILEPFGDQIVVLGSPLLEGQAKALNRQKNAINISNLVAADQIGKFPDPNAAEAIQRIPAVTLTRDQGEGRYVLVRGTEARLNSTTINGERIPSPEAGIRDIALDVIPADLLQSIEVSKALTPDMDGDAIGGTVDLVTKRAPEETRAAVSFANGYVDLTEDSISNGSLTYGRRYNDKKTGLLLSASAISANRGSDNFEPEYDDGELDELQLRDYTFKRERTGATVSIDQKSSDQAEYYVRGLWNNYQDTEVRRAKRERVGKEAIERVVRDRLQESDITSLTAGGLYQTGVTTVDYRVAWNKAKEETPNQITSGFEQEDVEFNPNVTPTSIDPNNIRANPLNEDFGAFEFDEIESELKFSEEEDLVTAIDVSRGFYRDESFSGLWKFGAKMRFKEKSQNVDVFAWGSEDDLLMSDFPSSWSSETAFLNGRYDIGIFPSASGLRQLFNSGALEGERVLDEDLADFNSDEDTLAGYAMGELAFGSNMTLLVGARVENTETTYQAFELSFDEEGDPTALSPVTGGQDYTEVLPMVHLKYQVDDKSNFRAAVTRTLARPNFEDLAPFQLTNFEDEEIVRGNPDLEVTTALNFDVLYERYLEPLGIISLGVFYKELDNNIFFSTFEEDIGGTTFDVEQPINGEKADLLGFEFAYQNRFAKLPAPWDGLGLYFNYTWVDGEADYPDRPAAPLQGQAEQTGNLALSYEKGGFSGQVSLNLNSEYILLVGGEPERDEWIDEHFQVDLSLRQQLNDRWSLFLDLINLDDEPYRVYEGVVDRPRQEEYYSWWGTFGFRIDF